jgi:hypothetical protein
MNRQSPANEALRPLSEKTLIVSDHYVASLQTALEHRTRWRSLGSYGRRLGAQVGLATELRKTVSIRSKPLERGTLIDARAQVG